MATADQFYADPSALLKLYLNEPESRAMTTWWARQAGSLAVTHHGRVELVNGLALARPSPADHGCRLCGRAGSTG